MRRFLTLYFHVFIIPVTVLIGIIIYLLLGGSTQYQHAQTTVILTVIALGSVQLVVDSVRSILDKSLALDYIAIAAILLGVITQEYIPAAIVVLMMSGGNALEKYAINKARSSLQQLRDRVPNFVTIVVEGVQASVDISTVKIGDILLVRKGEVIGLDGKLISKLAEIDESSLTGESMPVNKIQDDTVRSGTLNIGDTIEVSVSTLATESTYRKITDMVMQAQSQKTRFIQLADKYSLWFTFITFLIAAITYLATQDPQRILAVLVIATPCPLILATPVALIGGVNSAAAKNIVIKNMAVLETIDKCSVVIFDKTGTLTIGQPQLVAVNPLDEAVSIAKILSLATALERNSLHPFAKSIVHEANARQLPQLTASNVQEILGQGISGEIEGEVYRISKALNPEKSTIELWQQDKPIGEIVFADVIKTDAREAFRQLQSAGYRLVILSGDKRERVAELVTELDSTTEFVSDVLPEQKLEFIKHTQSSGSRVVMIGDGINDAPALAAADVGIVFSHQEYTASAAAGDVVLLKNDVSSVLQLVNISQQTIGIAKQSIYVGLGLSIAGMCLASFGFILPVAGAVIQEVIDVGVIFNSLRSSRIS